MYEDKMDQEVLKKIINVCNGTSRPVFKYQITKCISLHNISHFV